MGRAVRAAVVLLAVAAASAPAAPRVPQGFLGVAADGPMFDPGFDVAGELGRMTRAGVESIVTEVNWAAEQPARGRPPDFSRTDRIVLEAARRRIGVLAVVVYAPGWAAVRADDLASPPKPAAYARFQRRLIARYGPRGSLWAQHPGVPRLPVRDWQVWNEPSHGGFWSVQPFARGYVRLLRAAHRAIRAADPGARVVLAGLVYDSWRQLGDLYAAGARGLFDAVSLHPYTRRVDDVVRVLKRVRGVLDRHRDRRVPLLVTELSWPSSVGRAQSRYGYEVTEAQQAAKLREALPRLAALRARLRLQRVYWFTWVSRDADPVYPFDYAGLRKLTPGGLRSKPALAAYRRTALRLEGCARKGRTARRCG